MDYIKIGKRLKSIFKEKGLRQMEISEKTGFQQSVISEMLNGKRNVLPLVEKVCSIYGYSRDYIITGEENNRCDIIAENHIGENGLSLDERKRLLDNLNELYNKHQQIVSKLQDVMKEITFINKLLILNNKES